MEQNTKQNVKLIILDEKPYIVSLDKIQIGDKVILTVNGQYPTILTCENEIIYNLVVENKLSSNQSFKIFMEPENVKFTSDQIEKILENEGLMEVEFDGSKYNFNL